LQVLYRTKTTGKKKLNLFYPIRYNTLAMPGRMNGTSFVRQRCALLHPINFNEPFGMSVAEAMLCGTPVIAFNKGSMPELIKDEKTGFLVDTVDEAVDAIGQLGSINRARIFCREWAGSQFSKEKMAADYLGCIKRILGV
jgi:glycosyltransferase involved in cell wall biosynthesis